jgi:hypothetical protein
MDIVNRNQTRKSHPLYKTWRGIKDRCFRSKSNAYHKYGARGIIICERWAKEFWNFVDDMGPKPDGMSIDRIDNNGNYEPGNCRWATAKQQSRNKRTNRYLTIYGKTMALSAWCEISGVKYQCAKSRLCDGWSEKESIFGRSE